MELLRIFGPASAEDAVSKLVFYDTSSAFGNDTKQTAAGNEPMKMSNTEMDKTKLSPGELPEPPVGRTGWPWTEASEPLPDPMPSGQDWPAISVVTPSYNQGEFVEKTLRSVLLQGYPNLEYIVIDGGSTDGSVQIIEKYAPWLDDWVSETDRGQSHAINKGFARATGEILGWLNSDDYYLPGALGTVARSFAGRDAEVGGLVGRGHKVDLEGQVTWTPPEADELTFETILDWNQSAFMQPSCFFRRAAWEKAGPLREDLNYCMDVDLWLKIAQDFRFERIGELLSEAIHHEQAKNAADVEQVRAENVLLMKDHGAHDRARRIVMEQADRLARLKRQKRMITDNPLYQRIIGPLYHRLRTIMNGSSKSSP